MTLPAVIRIFFAIDLPPEVKNDLGKYIKELKKQAKSNGIRWTKEDNLHITLQFLAEVKSEDLTKLLQTVHTLLQNEAQQTTFEFGQLHLFPNPYRPRVIVLDLAPQEGLRTIATTIANAIALCAYPTESRPFRGHLTLGRIKQPQGTNLNFLNESVLPTLTKIAVNEIILFRSEPDQHGSKYTVLEKIALASKR